MSATIAIPTNPGTRARPLRVGFITLTDAAPVIVAQEHGLFRKHGLQVELSRELGWATIRDKVVYRELEASHALATMVISTALGGSRAPAYPCISACSLNRNGNVITLSEALWKNGVRDAATLRSEIVRLRHERQLVFGVVYLHSTHHILLCDWLQAAGINPRKDVRIVVVPPAQLFRNLQAGTLDGYCVGEPWGSLAVREGAGWAAALSCDLKPGHLEKVLMVRGDFAEQNEEQHLALVAATAEAALLCDQPEFRPQVVKLLARPEYLNVPERILAPALLGPFNLGHGQTREATDIITFGHPEPEPEKAGWLIEGLQRHALIPAGDTVSVALGRTLFRADLFHQAMKRAGKLSSVTPSPTSTR